MATSSSNKQTDSSQFSLKHRLIGAGILISFGVLILPWILGSYSIEHDQAPKEKEVSKREAKPSSIASLVSGAGSKTVAQERSSDSDKKPNSEAEKADDGKTEVKVFKSRVQPIESVAKEQEKPEKKKSIANKIKTTVENKSTSQKQKTVNKAATDLSKKQVAKKVIKEKPAETKAATANKESTTINRGYIVSVGVFGDVKNVEKMVSDLKSKNFTPEVRKETFNKKSVSRIFIGPYSTRAEAGKIKLRLSEKGISKTLIKAFP